MKETLSLGRTKNMSKLTLKFHVKIFSHLSEVIPVFFKQSQMFHKDLPTAENKLKLNGSCC